MLLAAIGIRVGEALQLKLDDLNLDSDSSEVYVRGEYTKSGDRYPTFLTAEAKEAMIEWLKVRQAYLESSANGSRGLAKTKRLNDNRIFPFSLTVAEQMKEFYKKAGPYLLIDVPKDIAEMQTKFQNDLDELRE